MREIYVVLISGFLASQSVQVLADEIVLEQEGCKLKDNGATVAFFSSQIFKGVYRKVDAKIYPQPEIEESKK